MNATPHGSSSGCRTVPLYVISRNGVLPHYYHIVVFPLAAGFCEMKSRYSRTELVAVTTLPPESVVIFNRICTFSQMSSSYVAFSHSLHAAKRPRGATANSQSSRATGVRGEITHLRNGATFTCTLAHVRTGEATPGRVCAENTCEAEPASRFKVLTERYAMAARPRAARPCVCVLFALDEPTVTHLFRESHR